MAEASGVAPVRTLSRLIAVALVAVLAGCSGSGQSGESGGTHVCIVTDTQGLSPNTANQLAVNGARGAGVNVRVIPSHAASDYLGNLQHCADTRPDLVIAVSSELSTAVWRSAQLHPRQRYALVDGTPIDQNGQSVDLENVASLLFKEQEPGYLVGAMAGLMEKQKVGNATHNVLGVLGLNHDPLIDAYIAGYVAGARAVDPSVTFKLAYSDSQDPAFCKQLGITQISASADILFEVTGRCASGYIDAAYDASAYAIGTNVDQAYLSPAVITSAVKRIDHVVSLTVQKIAAGQFKSGKQLFSMQDDATGFTTPSSVVPQDVINQVLDLRAKIRSGAVKPPDTVPAGI